jgi:hypothetical protein
VIMVKKIIFFEEKKFVRSRSEGVLIIVVIILEGIIFFEKRRFVKGRSEDEPLIIIVIVIEKIIFAVFNSRNMRNLIVSITVDLTNSIISLLMASERYED